MFYFTSDHRQWLHVKQNTEIISKLFQPLKLFQNNFSSWNNFRRGYVWIQIKLLWNNCCLLFHT